MSVNELIDTALKHHFDTQRDPLLQQLLFKANEFAIANQLVDNAVPQSSELESFMLENTHLIKELASVLVTEKVTWALLRAKSNRKNNAKR